MLNKYSNSILSYHTILINKSLQYLIMNKKPAKEDGSQNQTDYEEVTGETCPVCHKKTLTLIESRQEVPYFGTCYLFSMDCASCGYHKADIEAEETHEPAKYTFKVENEDDLKTRVIKSANATVKIGAIGTIEPGENANGYITNIEGILNRIKNQIENLKEGAQAEGDKKIEKRAKNHLKKLTRIFWGQEQITITIKDPTGNSTIISPKAEKKKL